MADSESTCWSVIEAAAAGGTGAREEFVSRYGPVVRAYLAARWKSSLCLQDLEDCSQEIFLACLRPLGILDRADCARGFRPFFFGVIRNVALRYERDHARRRERAPPADADLDDVADGGESLSRVFDRAWAKALLQEAAGRMANRAREAGKAALQRVELLRLRFQDQLPIRDIASQWGVEAGALHHEYAKARQEFRAALTEVVTFHHPNSEDTVEQECANLLLLLR
jgi:RNA polymerase sigma factor (sigma-70 family)